MARGRKAKASVAALKLAEALSFVKAATDDGTLGPYQTHVRLINKWAVAFDGTMTAGCEIEEDLNCCPHFGRLLDAITKCGNTLQITELDTGRLSIKGEKLRALVPCLPDSDVPLSYPDALIAPINNNIRDGFKALNFLISETAPAVVQASIMLQAGSVIATDRHTILEFWHGCDLPPNLILPKSFVQAIANTTKNLTGFGYSDASVTFYFEDGSFIKTLRYRDAWPDISHVIGASAYPVDVWPGFFDGIDAVCTFEEMNTVVFHDGAIWSHNSEETGAQYEVKGLPGGKSFNGKKLKVLANFTTGIDLTTYQDRMMIVGKYPLTAEHPNMRGAVMAIIHRGEQRPDFSADLDEEVPF